MRLKVTEHGENDGRGKAFFNKKKEEASDERSKNEIVCVSLASLDAY